MMDTRIIRVDDIKASASDIKYAAEIVKAGGLVAFPTETVYGLGADATNPSAVKRIFEAKGRPQDNPLIIHISTPKEAEKYTYTPEAYYRIAEAFMPGPITVIMRSRDVIPHETRAGLETVAVRCPENPVARELIREAGVPIAAPSANLSGSPSPTSAKHVIDDMMGRCEVIIDGGECEFGLESTIVKIEDDGTLTLLRPGKITLGDLTAIGFDVAVADAVLGKLADDQVALSPGMKYRHYAPKASVILLDGSAKKCIEYIKSAAEGKIAVIAYSEDLSDFESALSHVTLYDFGARCDELAQAHSLFNILRIADKEKFDTIFAPLPATDGVGMALYNRMIRAAAHKIVRL